MFAFVIGGGWAALRREGRIILLFRDGERENRGWREFGGCLKENEITRVPINAAG